MCGYVLHSTNVQRSILTYLLILIPGITLIYLCFDMDFRLAWSGVAVLGLDLVLLWLAGTSDPGYIPRQALPFAKGPLNAATFCYSVQLSPLKANPIDSEQVVLAYQTSLVSLKYCRTCKF